MKKRGIKAVIVTLLVTAIVLTGVSHGVVPAAAASVKLNKTSLSLVVGKSATLKVTGTKATVKWSSANKKIATVSAKGVVKAKKVGSTKVTAKVAGKKYVCKVTVKPKPNTNYTGLANWEKEELQKAVSAGILSKNLSYEFARDVTGGEFYNMLLAADKRLGLGKTRKLDLTAAEKKQTLTRQTAADWIWEMFEESLFYDYTRQHLFVGYGQDENGRWYGTKEEYDARETRWSLHNVLCYCDLTSNYPIMQVDENFCFRNEDKLTVLEAAQAAYRLTNSCMPEDDFVAFSKVDAYEPSEEIIALANAMPDVTEKSFSFRGMVTTNKQGDNSIGDFGTSCMYSDNQAKLLAEMGFNYTRIPIEYPRLFSADGKKINQIHIKDLDEYIESCIRYKVHACVALQYYPSDGDYHLDTITEFWKLLAERYRKIPNNALSFSILNEPGSGPEDSGKIDDMNQTLIHAVHSIDADRLLFCDGYWGNPGGPTRLPSEAIVQEENCVQVLHWFGGPFNGDNMYWCGGYAPADQWPFPFINDALTEETPITVNGEFHAGERIQVIAKFVANESDIRLATDKGRNYEIAAGTGTVRGPLTIFEVTLDEDCSSIVVTTNGWINVYELAIIHNKETERAAYFEEPGERNGHREIGEYRLVTNILTVNTGERIPWERSVTVNGDGTYQVTSDSSDYPLWLTDYTAKGFEDYLKIWQEFAERTGETYMVHSFGVYCSDASYKVRCGFTKAVIEALDRCGISWNTEDWGDLVRSSNDNYQHETAVWECIEGFYVCKQIREVYQK